MYVSIPTLEKELEEYVDYWNTHLMRKNKKVGTPSCVPDEMYEFPTLHGEPYTIFQLMHTYIKIYYYADPYTFYNYYLKGAADQIKPFDVQIWITAMGESENIPQFLPTAFEVWADDVLGEANINRNDISASNIRDFYHYLSCQEPPTFLD